jgi:hypothetical protein
MPLLNYTTEVPASKSIAEITKFLQDGGASAIMLEYATDRTVAGVTFRMDTAFGPVPYTLPANVGSVIATINAQIKTESAAINGRKKRTRLIPLRLYNDKAQAERIAWRIAKDWLEAQLALAQIGGAKLEQIMMPFARLTDGRSFYEHVVERGTLALPAPAKQERSADANI